MDECRSAILLRILELYVPLVLFLRTSTLEFPYFGDVVRGCEPTSQRLLVWDNVRIMPDRVRSLSGDGSEISHLLSSWSWKGNTRLAASGQGHDGGFKP